MLFKLIILLSCLSDRGKKEKSPIIISLSPESQSLQPNVNLIQELVRIFYDLFKPACVIPCDETIFGVDNSVIPLYIVMQDVFEIIQENQWLNIELILLWIM